MWLYELKELGIVKGWDYHPKSYELAPALTHTYLERKVLKTKTNITSKVQTIFPATTYTPDFVVHWGKILPTLHSTLMFDRKHSSVMVSQLSGKGGLKYSVVEVKGMFDWRGETGFFRRLRSIVYSKSGDIVNLVKLPGLFEQTFTPTAYLTTLKTKQKRKIKFEVVSLTQFLKRTYGRQ